ncbi:Thiamine pyrophosphokinase [Lachnellula occidentalis]|uniref:Thiamine pyrophosphokinase n=1 Tax=Lachnellula occidentalis TaxID=215460 RepID=A0A8H8S8K4_9HELO|nr:Thiamine pyrophosphokinase [Lachnellula occidentalis]
MATIENTTTWHPADVFSDNPTAHKDCALVVLNQPLELKPSLYAKIWKNAIYKVAADGAANRIHDLNTSHEGEDLTLDLVIGDLDSISPEATKYWADKGVKITHDSDQYSTDYMKAVNHIWSEKPKPLNIVAIGGLGGRVDQGLSMLHHLYLFQKDYASGKMFLLSSEGVTFLLKSGKHRIKAKETFQGIGLGQHVGLIPMKEPSIITTKGLEWDVTDWPTEFGGQISTSNHVQEEWVVIETTKDVLFTIDLNVLPQESG